METHGWQTNDRKWICKGSIEIQTKHSSINIHKQTNVLQLRLQGHSINPYLMSF